MRLVGLALSAALLSGCSFVGGMGQKVGSVFNGSAQSGSHAAYGGYADPCQIPHAQAPIPRGCHPSQVSIGVPRTHGAYGGAHPGGFPQQPQFGHPQGGAQYATGHYGTHAQGNAHLGQYHGASASKIRRPRFRGALDLGLESSVSGNLIDTGTVGVDPFVGYNPYIYQEGRTEGSQAEGQVRDITYYADSRLQNTSDPWDFESVPDISFKDAWSTPTTIGVSGEFILSDRATLFGRAGYTRAEGTSGGAATLEATVFKHTDATDYVLGPDGISYVVTGRSSWTEYVPEQQIAEVSYDFSDLERYDLEAGGRLYFDPIAGQSTGRTVTPFIGAAAGASHYNAVSYTLDQRQLSYESVYEDEELFYYDIDDNPANAARGTRVDLYDSQWVPTGRLNAGVEWQVTPRTALAFETGVRFEGARDYSNGAKGDDNISVPVTLRGSFNF